MDPVSLQIISKRKLNELSDTSQAESSYIFQITPSTIAVGSYCKGKTEPFESSVPSLHLISGNFFDPNASLNSLYFHMPMVRVFNPDKPPVFRFSYLPER